MTLGAGCLVGAVISPASWLGIPLGVVFAILGWVISVQGGNK